MYVTIHYVVVDQISRLTNMKTSGRVSFSADCDGCVVR
jgi:hypothetical protein